MCGMFSFSQYIYLQQKNPDEIGDFCEDAGYNPAKKTELVDAERPLIFVERLPVIVERLLIFVEQ